MNVKCCNADGTMTSFVCSKDDVIGSNGTNLSLMCVINDFLMGDRCVKLIFNELSFAMSAGFFSIVKISRQELSD